MHLWNNLLSHLLSTIEGGFSKPLLKRISFKECQNDQLMILLAEDAFTKGWFEENCIPILDSYLVENHIDKTFRIELAPLIIKNTDPVQHSFSNSAQSKPKPHQNTLASDFIFDRFIPGTSNAFPYQAALKITHHNSCLYNPLIIFGKIGTGKTHLAQAIAHEFNKINPSGKNVYVTSEDFTNEFVKHIQHKEMVSFREKYRKCDLLIVDDIQDLQDRGSTSDELENIFNALISRGVQMVFVSDRGTEKLKSLKPRLKARLSGGLAIELTMPNFETRKAILLDMSQKEAFNIEDKVLNLIAEVVDDNVRSLKGTLLKLFAYADLKKKEISLKLAKEILSDKIDITLPKNLSVNEIQKSVSNFFGIKPIDMKSKRKLSSIAYPRQIAMYIASKYTHLTSTEIGSLFSKSHSTVIRSTQKIENELPKNRNLQQQVERILLELSEAI